MIISSTHKYCYHTYYDAFGCLVCNYIKQRYLTFYRKEKQMFKMSKNSAEGWK